MDAAFKNINQDRKSFRAAVWVSVLLAFVHLCSNLQAQDASVTPEVDALQIAHSMTDDIQAFPATRWNIANSVFDDGCVVQWSLAPFRHESNPQIIVDGDVALRMVRSGRSSRWRTTSDFDSTNFRSGKNEASVAATSTRRGNGVAELSIRFRTSSRSTLAAGKYHTTLIGTISGL